MRVYVGELDGEGRARVWVAHEGERVDLAELVDVLGQLRALSDPVVGAELDRETVLARKQALIDRIEATGSLPAPVELVHRRTHSPDGFSWGYIGDGSDDLAQSILCLETGMDVAREAYVRFCDDVIAALPHRSRFRLPSAEVHAWLAANRTLVERSLLEEPPRPAVVAADAQLASAGQAVAVPDSGATASAVVSACEAAWADIRRHHPELPEAVMILGSGIERGRLVKLGHWWGGRWLAEGQVRGEVLLAGEALHLPADQVFEVLLHEAAHGLNAAAGVKDTSRGGRYHNQRFAESARRVLLHVRATPPYGLAGTTLTPEARERYGATIEHLGEDIRIARTLGRDVSPGVGGSAGGAGGGGGQSGEDGGKARGSLSASCGCGRKLRMAPSVLAKGPVLCGVCGHEFSTGAEVAGAARPERTQPTGPAGAERADVDAAARTGGDGLGAGLTGPAPVEAEEHRPGGKGRAAAGSGPTGLPTRPDDHTVSACAASSDGPGPGTGAGETSPVVDHGFLERRRTAVDHDRRVSDLRAVVAEQRRALETTPEWSQDADAPGLDPLRARHARLGALVEGLGDGGTGAPSARQRTPDVVPPPSSTGAELAAAVPMLAAEAQGEPRLAAWYQGLGTLRAEPMVAADAADAAALTRLARALLVADGTLSGPEVEVGGTVFQAGDRVIATAEVAGGPPAGVPGSVVDADPDLGAVRVDFPTWGTVRTPLASALARCIDHDYATVQVPEAVRATVGIDRELERFGLEVEP